MHIPEFVPAPGLGLCITLASSLPSRCISFAPQVAPDAMEVVGVRTDGEASDGLLKSSGPVTVVVSETLYISVRAHDPNPEDAVVISVKSAVSPYFPARQITVRPRFPSWLTDLFRVTPYPGSRIDILVAAGERVVLVKSHVDGTHNLPINVQ